MSANKSPTPVAIFVLCFDNRCDFNYYTTHRRLTDLPSGLHHGTSVLWLHAKKADFPLGKTQLLAAAEESLGSTDRHTCLSPESISESSTALLYLYLVVIIYLFLFYLNVWTQAPLISESHKL